MATSAGMVIVGAGEAGARAAVALREQGWTGKVTLIGEEPHAPYERPPLSKAAMVSETEPEAATIVGHDRLAEHDITFLHTSRAEAVDRDARVVHAGGQLVEYDRLLLATGAQPRRLTVPGAERALYLRNFADALAMRARLRPGTKLVVIGGGFIGLEIAASATVRGCAVTLIEAAPRLLMRGVPAEIAAIVGQRHAEAGVAIRLGVGIAAILADRVVLADGSEHECDAVVAGIGAVPETALATGCGLTVEDGIRVDDHLRTDDAAIYAAGDCCSFPATLYDGRRLRLEAWRNAQAQGAHAAANMLGHDEPFDDVPWFWSDQYDQTLQVAGLPSAGVSTVRREGDGTLIVFHLDETGRLVAVSAVGKPSLAKDVKVAEMMIARRVTPDPASLASSGVRLRSLLPA